MRLPLTLKVVAAFFLTWLLPESRCLSQQILLGDKSLTYRLDRYVEVFIDSTEQLTIADIGQADFQDKFIRRGDLRLGFLRSAIWLKLDYHIPVPDQAWYLEIPAPFLEYVDFYQPGNDGTWHHTSSGYFRKQSEKHFSHTGHVHALRHASDSISTVYVRIAGISPKTFSLHAIEREKFLEKIRWEDLGYGIFFGVLMLMFFYNVYIYLTLRQKNYFLYSCIIVCTGAIFAAISGYGGKFLWPESPILNYINGKLALELLIIILTIYVINFLEVKKYSVVMYYILCALIPLAGLAMVLSVTNVLTSAGNNLISVSTVVFMATGIVVRIKGNKTGTYFIVAWTFYFLGGLFLTLRNSGVFDYGFWTTHFAEIGAVLGTSMIGFGLGVQYRTLKKEKEEAQLLALKFQQEATARLEMRVNERTEQLYKANKELQHTLETNRKQTQIIESKNAELDTFFYRISHDLKGPVSASLALMDLAKVDVRDKVALEYIEKEHAQLERLNHLISGLLSLARLNNSESLQTKIDFEQLIDDCILSFSAFKNFSRVTFIKQVQPHIEFYSEWTVVNAIIQNLIENGIKYCRGESPFVRVQVYEEPGTLVVKVEDNGQGIPAEHREKIFDMFYRATNEEDGSGLGLYILKRSVERLKGTIQITSEVGQGSVFVVRLPQLSAVDGEVPIRSARL